MRNKIRILLLVLLLGVLGMGSSVIHAYSGLENIERPKIPMSEWCFEISNDPVLGQNFSGLVPGSKLTQLNIEDGNGQNVKLAKGKSIIVVDMGISESSLLMVEYLRKTFSEKLQIVFIIPAAVQQKRVSLLEEKGVGVYAECTTSAVQYYFHQVTQGYVYLVDEKKVVQSRFATASWLKYLKVLQAFVNDETLPTTPPSYSFLDYGKRVPDFSPMLGIDGKEYRVSDFTGKPTIFLFINELRLLDLVNKVHLKYGDRLNIVLIKDDEEKIKALHAAELERIGLPCNEPQCIGSSRYTPEYTEKASQYLSLINQTDNIYIEWNISGSDMMLFVDANLCLVEFISFNYSYDHRNPKETNEKQLEDTLFKLTERLFQEKS